MGESRRFLSNLLWRFSLSLRDLSVSPSQSRGERNISAREVTLITRALARELFRYPEDSTARRERERAMQEAGCVLRQKADPFIFPYAREKESARSERRSFVHAHDAYLHSCLRLIPLCYKPLDEAVNDRIERNVRIRFRRIDAPRQIIVKTCGRR